MAMNMVGLVFLRRIVKIDFETQFWRLGICGATKRLVLKALFFQSTTQI